MHLAKRLGAVLAVLLVSTGARTQTAPASMDHAAHDTATAHEEAVPTLPDRTPSAPYRRLSGSSKQMRAPTGRASISTRCANTLST
jgi:hypothetical protein